jgi:hypothetical protein
MVAALFVATNGIYFGLPNVDPWDKRRDARTYAGPHPVVAHPPCALWNTILLVLMIVAYGYPIGQFFVLKQHTVPAVEITGQLSPLGRQ